MERTEDLAWLVALLSPRDIAIHPNFASQETVTAPAGLALIVSSQSGAFTRLESTDGWKAAAQSDPVGAQVVSSIQSAFSLETIERGAAALEEASRTHIQERPCLAAVCAIVASASYAELDRLEDAQAVLLGPVEVLSELRDSKSFLLVGALLVNLALREWDQRLPTSAARAESARTALLRVISSDLPPFPLSLGVAWDSTTSLNNVIELLLDGCAHHAASNSTDFQSRLDLVREPPARLTQRARGRIATAFQKYLQQELGDTVQARGVTWSIEGTDGDSELCEALNAAEFTGHPNAHYYRRLLGMHRFLRGMASGEEWLIREAIRLIRQSGDKRQLSPVVAAIRNRGPLTSLRDDALQALSRRRTGALLREVELIVVRAAAPLLPKAERADGVRLLLSTHEYETPHRGQAWEHRSVRLGALWRTVVELARNTEQSPSVARRLFQELRDARPDGALDQDYARSLNRLEPAAWQDPELVHEIVLWINSEDSGEFHPESRAALQRMLGIATPWEPYSTNTSQVITLDTIQLLIDRSLVHGEIFPASLIESAQTILTERMVSVREAAARGQYSWGGASECELAVALALLTNGLDLWPQIADFLCDARVQRGDKTSALERMIRNVEHLPPLVASSIRGRTADLLNGGPSFMGEASAGPFPEGLRLSAILGLLDSTEVLDQVGRLLGEHRPDIRRAGAEVLLDLLAARFDYPWLSTSAMLLTQDRDTEVRATAGRALTQLDSYGEIGEGAVTTRIISLLEEDGYLIPNSVLVGLIDRKRPISERLRRKITAIAATHIDESTRSYASQLLRDVDSIG